MNDAVSPGMSTATDLPLDFRRSFMRWDRPRNPNDPRPYAGHNTPFGNRVRIELDSVLTVLRPHGTPERYFLIDTDRRIPARRTKDPALRGGARVPGNQPDPQRRVLTRRRGDGRIRCWISATRTSFIAQALPRYP